MPRRQGSICLLLQTSLPCILFAPGPCDLTLLGGTNAEMAPQIDYVTRVLQPTLKRFGVEFAVDIRRRGFFPRVRRGLSRSRVRSGITD